VIKERRPRGPHLKLVTVGGNPTEDERRVLDEALERLVKSERGAAAPSLWLRAGRAQGRRLGTFDYRDRFEREDAWRLSTRFPFGGREYSGLHGRGDAK
jgi:hypothetical protein